MPSHRRRKLLLLLPIIAIVAVVVTSKADRPTSILYQLGNDAQALRPFPHEERNWRSVDFELLPWPKDGASSEVLAPFAVAVDPEGNLFVMDLGDATVKKLSPDGDVLSAFPKEFSATRPPAVPIDFALDTEGRVWLASGDAKTATLFAAGGEREAEVELGARPHRIARTPDHGFIVMSVHNDSTLFRRYGPTGELVREFGRILEGELQEPILLEGNLTTDDRGALIWASSRLGMIAAYEPDGELRYVIEAAGSGIGSIPEVLLWPDGRQSIEPGARRTALAVHASGGRLWVLSERESTATRGRILDIYASEDGTYLHSIRLPNRPADAVVTHGFLYTISARGLERWRMHEPQESS